jgi:hypothetical protein
MDKQSEAETQAECAQQASLFAVSAGMLGACLTGIGLIKVAGIARPVATLCDDLLVLDAILYTLTAHFSYRAQRELRRGRGWIHAQVADRVFSAALLVMLVVCALLAWTLL